MKKTIKSKNIEITKEIKKYIDEKVDSLEKFLNIENDNKEVKSPVEIVVEVEKETNHHQKGFIFKAEMILSISGKTLFAKYTCDNLNNSILEAKEELLREIKKNKSKKVSLNRRKARVLKKDLKLASEARMYRKGRIRDEGL